MGAPPKTYLVRSSEAEPRNLYFKSPPGDPDADSGLKTTGLEQTNTLAVFGAIIFSSAKVLTIH